MTENAPRDSAKIYQFPAGGRAALSKLREDRDAIAERMAARLPRVALGSGWYHEEAIQEDEQPLGR
ncbi:MAG: DUF2735 domain-containing protein [Hyphomicrobium sp.]|uniref:DUF2735 domain-containing protein n=1 Tax=Hyphomicrobium sp. TaxID=82 RepID=UPI003D0EE35C